MDTINDMKTIREIHVKNLKLAISRCGKIDKLLDAIEARGEKAVSKKYLQNVINGVQDKAHSRPRDVGPGVCRKIELALAEPEGWMDVDHENEKRDQMTEKERRLLEFFRMMTDFQQDSLVLEAEAVKKNNEMIVEALRGKMPGGGEGENGKK